MSLPYTNKKTQSYIRSIAQKKKAHKRIASVGNQKYNNLVRILFYLILSQRSFSHDG